jgi:hypothetical protein
MQTLFFSSTHAKEHPMATSSLLGGTPLPREAAGNDMQALGPSDNSDSGSDALGAYGDGELASDSDAAGTGERAAFGTGMDKTDADILPDHLEGERGQSLDGDVESVPGDGDADEEDADEDEDEDLGEDDKRPGDGGSDVGDPAGDDTYGSPASRASSGGQR